MTADSNRAREICSNALEINSLTAQDSYITDACQGDQQLLSQVRALLAAHWDHSDSDFELNDSSADNLSRIQEQPGSQIGRYRLIKQIGKGGMGIVFLAEQKKPVSRLVALKIVKPGMDSQEVIARFHAEQQALALMNHPNIAQVFDAGITDSGRPYFVMEMVDGVPLTQFCDDNQLTIQARLKLFVTLCEAIQHAHQKGIIHRDLKPSNILVKMHAGQPVPKVIDFGIAKAMGFQLADRTTLTRTYQVVGTPLYMSPEQADCQGLFIDTRSDIYSLSVLLYELLAGKLPFENLKHQKHPVDEMLRLLREAEPAHPSQNYTQLTQETQDAARFRQSEPAKLYQAIRGDLDWIVMKGLEKDPARRYQTAMSLGDDIQRYFNNEPVLAGPPTTIYRVRKLIVKHKGLITTALSFLLFLILGSVVSLNFAFQAQEAQKEEAAQRQQAELAEAKARQHLEKVHQVIEQMLVHVGRNELAETPHMLVTRKKLLEDAIGWYSQLLEDESNPEIRYSLAATCVTQADILRALGQLDELEPLHTESISLLEQLVNDYPQEEKFYSLLSRSYVSLAWTCQKIKEREKELLAYQQAQTAIERLLEVAPSDKNQLALALRAGQYAAALYKSDPDRSVVEFEKSFAAYQTQIKTLGAENRYRYAGLLRVYGELLTTRNQYERAKESITRSIELLQELTHAEYKGIQQKEVQVNLALGHSSLSDLYRNRKLYFAAIDQLMSSLEISRELSHQFPDYPGYLKTYQTTFSKISSTLSECDSEAEQHQLIHRLLAWLTPEDATEYCFRADLYSLLKDQENAEQDYLQTLKFEPQNVKALSALAYSKYDREDYSAALSYFDKLIQSEPENPNSFYHRGATFFRLKQNEKALTDYSKAIELADDRAYFYFSRYRVFRAMLRNQEALGDLQMAISLSPDYAGYYYESSRTKQELGQLEAALADINKAISLDSKKANYYLARHLIYREQKRTQQAMEDLNQIIRLSPESAGYHYTRFKYLDSLGKKKEALPDLQKAISLKPDYAGYYYDASMTKRALGQSDDALVDINKAIELNSKNPKYFFERYTIYRRQNQIKQAREDLDQVIRLAPDTANYYYVRYQLNRSLGSRRNALADISQAITLSPRKGIYYFQRGELYLNYFQEYEKALTDINRCFALSEPQGYQYKRRALAHFYLKKYEESIQDLIRAIELSNHELSALTFISPDQVHACSNQNFKHEMLRVTTRLKEITPGEGRGYTAHAFFLAEYGDPEKIMAELAPAIAILKDRLANNVDAPVDNKEIGYGFYMTHGLLHASGRDALANRVFEIARHYYEQLHEKYPENSNYRKWLFYYYLNQAQYELEHSNESVAHRYYSNAVRLRSRGYIAYQFAAWPILVKPRKSRELEQSALKWSQAAVQVSPGSENLRTMLSVARYRNGLYQETIESVKKEKEPPPNRIRMTSINGSSGSICDALVRKYLLAMSHYQLGDQTMARKLFLQTAVWHRFYDRSKIMLDFRAEAERTLDLPLTAVKPVTESDTQNMR